MTVDMAHFLPGPGEIPAPDCYSTPTNFSVTAIR